MADHPRIEELRRRVQNDPASIAFAQLAEEYRRTGSYEDAIAICRAGLAVHPTYLSARVTLGRALVEIHDLDAAEAELTVVLQHAPENLAAVRGLAEIHHRRGHLDEALAYYKTAMGLARHDPDLEQMVAEISRTLAPAKAPAGEKLSYGQVSVDSAAASANALEPPPKVDFAAIFDAVPGFDDLGAIDEPIAVVEVPPVHEAAAVDAPPPVEEQASVAAPAPLENVAPAVAFQEIAFFTEPAILEQPAALQTTAVYGEVGGFDAPTDAFQREPEPQPVVDPALPGLERFLEAIHSYNQRRAS